MDSECDVVVSSVFVNPKQFGPNEDFDRYPRTFEEDCRILNDANADFVFCPPVEEMYPQRFITEISLKEIPQTKEALSRPGFFNGVATVVAKLFNIIQPSAAYFGQKDAMQCIVIRNLVADLNFPIDVRICDTVREDDGLAMSSRNRYLSPEERRVAAMFSAALFAGQEKALTHIKREDIITCVERMLVHPMIQIDYISLASLWTGQEISQVDLHEGALLSAAINIGKTRLIDNVILRSDLAKE
eukprot:TRINITY_DN558_c0_g1_i4.p1 TRINITY_DN558_c0_g1~~TRINITY_DN558_c0_g1_i4.p1  ORF type:complete len:244 (-),score=30.11 TRINITY_DN558_c0_g1_i4:71-802(-)